MNLFIGVKPDRTTLGLLSRYRGQEHEGLAKLFRQKLEEVKTSLVIADDEHLLRRLQGQAKVLQDFLEALETAPSVLERLK
jgi:hypothetical protein